MLLSKFASTSIEFICEFTNSCNSYVSIIITYICLLSSASCRGAASSALHVSYDFAGSNTVIGSTIVFFFSLIKCYNYFLL